MTRSTRGEELLLLLLMLSYLLLCSDSRHAKRAENVNAIDRKSSEFVAGKLGKKDMISAFQRQLCRCARDNGRGRHRNHRKGKVVKETLLRRSRKGGGVLGRETRT